MSRATLRAGNRWAVAFGLGVAGTRIYQAAPDFASAQKIANRFPHENAGVVQVRADGSIDRPDPVERTACDVRAPHCMHCGREDVPLDLSPSDVRCSGGCEVAS